MPFTDEDLVKAAEMDSEPSEQEEKSTPDVPEPKDPAPEPDKKDEPTEPAKPEPEAENKESLDEKPEKVEVKAEEPAERKPTRKERREERKKSIIEASRRDKAPTQPSELPEPRPHEPLDFDKSEQFDVEDLKKDRDAVVDNARLETAKLERQVAEQEKFWDGYEYEHRILTSNPEFTWLDHKNPDVYDKDRAATVNELYLEMIGYQEEPLFHPQTKQPLIDPNTGQQMYRGTVKRTDISYEKFVKNFVDVVKTWADDQVEASQNNLAETKANAGVRPSGGSRKGLGELKPGDITKMSDEELERHNDEIDRQILAMLD